VGGGKTERGTTFRRTITLEGEGSGQSSFLYYFLSRALPETGSRGLVKGRAPGYALNSGGNKGDEMRAVAEAKAREWFFKTKKVRSKTRDARRFWEREEKL